MTRFARYHSFQHSKLEIYQGLKGTVPVTAGVTRRRMVLGGVPKKLTSNRSFTSNARRRQCSFTATFVHSNTCVHSNVCSQKRSSSASIRIVAQRFVQAFYKIRCNDLPNPFYSFRGHDEILHYTVFICSFALFACLSKETARPAAPREAPAARTSPPGARLGRAKKWPV